MGWVVNTTCRPIYPGERPGTYPIEGWVGPKASLDTFTRIIHRFIDA
jgi:hypothetical protein